jgi:hypothetical protein
MGDCHVRVTCKDGATKTYGTHHETQAPPPSTSANPFADQACSLPPLDPG